jgi:hypothetical protein
MDLSKKMNHPELSGTAFTTIYEKKATNNI